AGARSPSCSAPLLQTCWSATCRPGKRRNHGLLPGTTAAIQWKQLHGDKWAQFVGAKVLLPKQRLSLGVTHSECALLSPTADRTPSPSRRPPWAERPACGPSSGQPTAVGCPTEARRIQPRRDHRHRTRRTPVCESASGSAAPLLSSRSRLGPHRERRAARPL